MSDFFFRSIALSIHDVPSSVRVGMFLVFLIGAVLLLTSLGYKKGARWSAGLLLLEYIFLLLSLSVLFRPVKEARTYELIPFWSYRTVREGGHELLLTQMIMNVVAFFPIGLLLGISFPGMKWWTVLLTGGAFSLLIETLQFFLRRGFAEFDDVWHNVVGCMVGYGVYRGVRWMGERIKEKIIVRA